MPAFTQFVHGGGPILPGSVFPFCFITIACAAVSGFHSLIASGTTPKLIMRESHIRIVGYGAMITEMGVGIMALIAACAMQPGEYFAVNVTGSAATVTSNITALGFPVTEAQMADLAASVGEKTMIGRAGGAPTFAVGMAQMFAGVIGGRTAMALWYHFAIMFEALFILTAIDAGTRVGRFLMQDMLGHLWKPLGDTRAATGNFAATVLFVGGWGWFLYQGVIDPLGGIRSLWPIFGVANQLLAVLALALGTTVLLKMGRKRYVWVTLLPLGWLLSVTFTAGLMLIFSPNPRLGFLAAADSFAAKLAAAAPADAAGLTRQIFNAHVNAAVTGVFLLLVILIVGSCARVWVRVLTGQSTASLREEPYVALAGASVVK
jgi:carbon starvation protein